MALMSTAQGNHRIATALHEAAHAMAYISMGHKFQYLSVDDAVTAPASELMYEQSMAVICMAGPAAEGLMYCHDRGGEYDVVAYILRCHGETVEYAEVDPEEMEDSDYVAAGPGAIEALPTSLAIVSGTWSDIELIAEAALSSPDRLSYSDILNLIDNKHGGFNPALADRWRDIVGRSQAARQ